MNESASRSEEQRARHALVAVAISHLEDRQDGARCELDEEIYERIMRELDTTELAMATIKPDLRATCSAGSQACSS